MQQPLHVLTEPEDGGAARRAVGADALEDGQTVVQPRVEERDGGLLGRDQAPVHPDLLRLHHTPHS